MQFDLKEVNGLSESDQTHWKIRTLVINHNGHITSPALEALEEWSKAQKADFKKIIKVMKRIGQTTRVRDPKHVKKSTNPKHENVYEMRADKGHARLMFFYSKKNKTAVAVCTNKYWKGQGDQNQAFEQCDQLRKLYEDTKQP
jgi:putative component of toxin-antitoxin plasmid stabilization module